MYIRGYTFFLTCNFWFIMRFRQDEPCDEVLLVVNNKASFTKFFREISRKAQDL